MKKIDFVKDRQTYLAQFFLFGVFQLHSTASKLEFEFSLSPGSKFWKISEFQIFSDTPFHILILMGTRKQRYGLFFHMRVHERYSLKMHESLEYKNMRYMITYTSQNLHS